MLDLCRRASDYVLLERGRMPDEQYVFDIMTDAPPEVADEDIFTWGAGTADLDGYIAAVRGFYEPDEWYIGLALVAQEARGRGLGTAMVQQVMSWAQDSGAPCIRVAVLESNPRGHAFWERLGFMPETIKSGDDRHRRHVLRRDLARAPALR